MCDTNSAGSLFLPACGIIGTMQWWLGWKTELRLLVIVLVATYFAQWLYRWLGWT